MTIKQTPTLDPAQEIRIEAMHGGFLYQHLYAVACLLSAEILGATVVVVERDEDIELLSGAGRTYIQVKTRNHTIMPGDIKSALERFDTIREEHRQGRRSGVAAFVIVVNQALGPTLTDQLEAGQWPADVAVLWPGRSVLPCLTDYPPAWSSADEALAWCVSRASSVPLAMLAPDSLVWKLAGRVLAAAAGNAPHANHGFAVAQLPLLFEQLLIQLQDFPSPPLQYRPQVDEPQIDSGSRVRVISGFSGAGKTAWASQAATYSEHNCAYYDCAETPGDAVPLALVRELAARLAGASPEGMRRILMPGATGVEALRMLDIYLKGEGLTPIVVLDNVHRISAGSVQRIVNATSNLRFVLLAQPHGSLAEIEALLGLKREALNGWSVDEVAAAAAGLGCRGDGAAMGRLRGLTGGMPLFVQSASTIAREEYQGQIIELCDALEALSNTALTAQEVILARVFGALPPAAQNAVAVLSLSDIGLQLAEINQLLNETLEMDGMAVAAVIRALRFTGVVEVFGSKQIKLHDAMRVVGSQNFVSMPADTVARAQASLKELLVRSFEKHRDTSRFSLYARLLLATGDVKTLVALISEEMFHEMGVATEIWHGLEALVAADGSDPMQHYWALDGLVFSDIKFGRFDRLGPRFVAMETLIDGGRLGEEELLSFLMKRMTYYAHEGDAEGVRRSIAELDEKMPDKPAHRRVFRYNASTALLGLGRYEQALELATEVVDENFATLGITPEQVVGRKQVDLWALINKPSLDHADVKRLADSLELKALAADKVGVIFPMVRIQAMKFYSLAGAIDSLIRVGQALADEFIGRHDFEGAKQVLEQHVMPVVVGNNLLNRSLDVRAQYAIVLAYCGRYAEAEQEMARLLPYVDGLDERARMVVARQNRLIAQIKARPPIQWRPGVRPVVAARPSRPASSPKVGRNDPCPCGSGKKFKKCDCRLSC